jgi:hypothetical protein
VTAAQYRILSPAGAEREAGSADVEVSDGGLVLTPSAGAVLRVPFGHIRSVTEPEPFTITVTLTDGTAISLGRLGVMRTQLLAELRDGRGDAAASAAGAVGPAEVFSGISGNEPAEIRIYDDTLLIVSAAGRERIAFSFAGPVQVRDYVVTVEVTGREPVCLSRLGRRTGELADLIGTRVREARGRTAAFLGSLLPGLDPMAQREAAGLLRDGVATPAGELDRIHPDLSGALLRIAAPAERLDAITGLARRTGLDLALGFKQVATVRRPATGVTPWHDHAVAPHIVAHDSPGGSFRPGLTGMLAAGVMSGGPPQGTFGFGEGYGAYGEYWAFRALGAGMAGREQRPMAARPDLARGRLTPAAEDLRALTVTGENPTVLAFAMGTRPGWVIYEVLNQPEPMTYVYRGLLAAINRALDDAGFRPAAIEAQADRVPHDTAWSDRITNLLTCDDRDTSGPGIGP